MSNERTEAPAPQGDYVLATLHAGLIFSAGMTPRRNGALTVTGIVGRQVDLATARAAAMLAATNALAAVRSVLPPDAAGMRCLHMTVYVACTSDFTAASGVADGASAAIAAELGADALPARSAIGVCALPSGAPVEVQLVAAAL
ncbi:RidA family protein [Mycobacterium sp. ITM-2016-00316]|uniref:RidA family protein n=1 Tax=Mycobacterium sp. ITM-2016-00316 TaxID=2099695 RepID=UPI000CF8EDDE|nr:RidA family protein [Mycobacterium sp. ITM-2016-00316]WNG83029.1 RidA family protein [Mycobacterium sp. ITM-2016-00316]